MGRQCQLKKRMDRARASIALFCFKRSPSDAGNPAVMAPRFRPVALRPRLSAGLP